MSEDPTARRARARRAIGRALTAPRAAAVAGIAFALLLGTMLVLVRLSVPAGAEGSVTWLDDASRRQSLQLALNLAPYAGITFLWFIGVIRDNVGEREDRLFATVFLGSGLLFLAMLYSSMALSAALVVTYTSGAASNDVATFARSTTHALTSIYTVKMAAVFMISTSTIAMRSASLPRWLALLGFLLGLTLLIGSNFAPWADMIMPVWVLLLSVVLLIGTYRRPEAGREHER
ncbi:hypothetical protein [Actinoplanes sp. NPDC049118]|uniref:hypothetical protein n=1 Tax=Actinoplanes sp. NPDC049118 TaxID=3155769 RepID=UPI0033F1CFE1